MSVTAQQALKRVIADLQKRAKDKAQAEGSAAAEFQGLLKTKEAEALEARRLTQQVQREQEQLQRELAKSQRDLEHSQRELAQLQRELAQSQRELEHSQRELALRSHDKEEETAAKDSAWAAGNEAVGRQLAAHAAELARLTVEREELKAALEARNGDMEALEAEVKAGAGQRCKEVANLREQLSLYEMEIASVEKRLGTAMAAKARAESDAEGVRDRCRKDVEEARFACEEEVKKANLRCEKMVEDAKASCAIQVTEAKETVGRFQRLQRDLDESQAQIERWEVAVDQLGMEKEALMQEVAAAAAASCMYKAEMKGLTDEVRKLNADRKATESEQAKSVERLAAEHGKVMATLEAEIATKDSELAEVVMMLSNADDRREKEKVEEERRGEEYKERIGVLVSLVEACGADLGAICREITEVKHEFSFWAEEWEGVVGESWERMGQALKERDQAQRVANETQEEIRNSAKKFAQLIQTKVASLCARTRLRAKVCALGNFRSRGVRQYAI